LPQGRHKLLEKRESTKKGETGNYEGKPKQEKQYMKEKELKEIVRQ
jgi:hypothetical protein